MNSKTMSFPHETKITDQASKTINKICYGVDTMKRLLKTIISVSLSIGLLAGCSTGSMFPGNIRSYDRGKIDEHVVRANNDFAFNVFRQLDSEDGEKNIFISPLSISAALTMAYQGAGSTTRDAMAETLGYNDMEIEKINESFKNLLGMLNRKDKKIEINISNSIWYRQGRKIKDEFLSVNKDIFGASVSELDFSDPESADKINRWISDSTKGKIEKMIEPPIPADVVMYLINAIYFKGEWTEKFDKNLTFNSEFHSGNGRVSDIMMMYKNGNAEYGAGDQWKAVRLPYGKGSMSMYCILPEEGISVNDFIADMNTEKWEQIKGSISETEDVVLQIPRFKIDYGIKELKDSLTAMGMGEAFTGGADFSGIREDIYISSVMHKAVVEVNEEGSEAAAATVVEMTEAAAAEPIMFIADRPFVFIIADDETGSVLFMGKVFDGADIG